MDLKFAATSRPGPRDELVEWVQAAESLGYHRIGVADSPALYRDLWVSLTHVALNTHRLPFGPWVTNPVTRHPVVTASAASALAEIAPGRVCIGVGSGNSGVYNAGRRAATLASLREYVTTLRSLLTTGEAEYRGGTARLTMARQGKKDSHLYGGPRPWLPAAGRRDRRRRGHRHGHNPGSGGSVTPSPGGRRPHRRSRPQGHRRLVVRALQPSTTLTTRDWTPREVRRGRPTTSTASP